MKRRAQQLRRQARRVASDAVELYRKAAAIDGHDTLLSKRNRRHRDDLERILGLKDAELDALERRAAS